MTTSHSEDRPIEFEVVRRGYNIEAVDYAISELRAAGKRNATRAAEAEAELAETKRRMAELQRPSYSSLGAHLEHVMRLAEQHAAGLIQSAHAEAADIVAAANQSASTTRSDAERWSRELHEQTLEELARQRAQVEQDARITKENAAAEARDVTDLAEQKRVASRAALEQELAGLRSAFEAELVQAKGRANAEIAERHSAAQREADQILSSARTEAAESERRRVREEEAFAEDLARRWEEFQASCTDLYGKAKEACDQMIADASARETLAEQRLAEASTTSGLRRAEAEEYALNMMNQARSDSADLMAAARRDADAMIADAQVEAARVRDEALAFAAEVRADRDAIATRFEQIAELLGQVSLPETEVLEVPTWSPEQPAYQAMDSAQAAELLGAGSGNAPEFDALRSPEWQDSVVETAAEPLATAPNPGPDFTDIDLDADGDDDLDELLARRHPRQ